MKHGVTSSISPVGWVSIIGRAWTAAPSDAAAVSPITPVVSHIAYACTYAWHSWCERISATRITRYSSSSVTDARTMAFSLKTMVCARELARTKRLSMRPNRIDDAKTPVIDCIVMSTSMLGQLPK